jgi:hypothetical protein
MGRPRNRLSRWNPRRLRWLEPCHWRNIGMPSSTNPVTGCIDPSILEQPPSQRRRRDQSILLGAEPPPARGNPRATAPQVPVIAPLAPPRAHARTRTSMCVGAAVIRAVPLTAPAPQLPVHRPAGLPAAARLVLPVQPPPRRAFQPTATNIVYAAVLWLAVMTAIVLVV